MCSPGSIVRYMIEDKMHQKDFYYFMEPIVGLKCGIDDKLRSEQLNIVPKIFKIASIPTNIFIFTLPFFSFLLTTYDLLPQPAYRHLQLPIATSRSTATSSTTHIFGDKGRTRLPPWKNFKIIKGNASQD